MHLTLKRLLVITFTGVFVIWAAATALSLGVLKASNDRCLYGVDVSMGQMVVVERLMTAAASGPLPEDRFHSV